MTDQTRIEFPCDYPIRIIGDQRPDFRSAVLAIVRDTVDTLDESSVTVRESRDGTYCSVRVTIVATGEAQLETLHAALLTDPGVRMVL